MDVLGWVPNPRTPTVSQKGTFKPASQAQAATNTGALVSNTVEVKDENLRLSSDLHTQKQKEN